MTDDLAAFLDAAEARAAAATPGPWEYSDVASIAGGMVYDSTVALLSVHYDPLGASSRVRRNVYDREADVNGEFIAAARTDVPALVGMVRVALALCDEAVDGVPDSWQPIADLIADLRAALLAAIPPTPTAEETR